MSFFKFLRVGCAGPLLVLPGLLHAMAFKLEGNWAYILRRLYTWQLVLTLVCGALVLLRGLSSCTKLDWLPHMAISEEFSKKPNVETARPFEVRGWDLHKVTFSKLHWLKQVTRPAQVQEMEN